MKKKFKNGFENNLLTEEKDSVVILNDSLFKMTLDNNDYLKRCFSEVNNGKKELQKKLDDAKRVLLTKEDLINWLFKIKEDAKFETDCIISKYHGSLKSESEIEFEKVGFLSGIYSEADKYLKIINTIEPIDKSNIPYSVLDRLEDLDEYYVRTDNIPGYYSIQKDKLIKKKKYELKNLDDYWEEYLSYKDKILYTEDFGNTEYLLSQYHNEFIWSLIKLRPREEIKALLNFQLKNYVGEQVDFLNHIEYRIIPDLDKFAGTDYPIFQFLIRDWLKEKRNILNHIEESYLVESTQSVLASCLEGIVEFRKSKDENKYNLQLCLLFNQRFTSISWCAKDQSMGGHTDSMSNANKAGIAFRDIIIVNEKNHNISAFECFRLKSIPRTENLASEINQHLCKIFRNEPLGLSPLFIVVYCETKSFENTWAKYLDYVKKINFDNYRLVEFDKELFQKPKVSSIKIAKAKHLRDLNEINVYHFFVNMYP